MLSPNSLGGNPAPPSNSMDASYVNSLNFTNGLEMDMEIFDTLLDRRIECGTGYDSPPMGRGKCRLPADKARLLGVNPGDTVYF